MIRTCINAIFWMFFSSSMLVIGQNDAFSANISDCSGAIQMELNRVFKPKIPIKIGATDDLNKYTKKLTLPETNSLWFSFESSHSGKLMISLQKFNLPLEYGIFALSKEQDCSAIHLGEATLLTNEYVQEAINRKEIDSIPYSKNQVLFFFINTTSSVKNEIAVQAIFKEEVSDEEFDSMKKTFDFRATEKEAPFTIMIRDAKTKLPVVANVIVSESRTHNALYTASDMLFPYSDNLKMTLNVDASGYFFQDVLINTRKEENEELTIFLEALEQDQLIELEGLVFVMQSDVLVPEALPKLKRLKDFMVINTRVNIEIQGHVHLDGKNTFKAKRLSKKRAKTVKAFLVESGIDKKRISVVGYGNSKMIYPEAFSDAEKQANRRVEIKIK